MSEDAPGLDDPELERLLEHLKAVRGFDFTGYKRASLSRRVHRRMADLGLESVREYHDLLEADPDEFTALFNTILINVTAFLRDAELWQRLSTEHLPALLDRRPTGPLRIWSAGCASGQEAYTTAIALAELLGPDAFRERVKIYATDVDEEALTHARTATYSDREVGGLPRDLLEKYFQPTGARWTFRPDLRRSVIFGRADLVQDAPISHVDLLLCRNTLMYMTADTQSRIAERLHYSLVEGGLLVLGKAEMLISHSSLFAPVDLKNRVFRRVGAARAAVRYTTAVPPAPRAAPDSVDRETLQAQALMNAPVAQVLLDAGGRLALSNHRADALFGTSVEDAGRPFQDLEVSYRPVELRSAVARAHAERREVWIRDVRWAPLPDAPEWLDVQVIPVHEESGQPLGTTIAFFDVTQPRQLQAELEDAHRQLETAYEELQSTNEELETTNEELQSTVEELETTNEELHSSNEELETMNEELQSMNDELQLSNAELRARTDQVGALSHYVEGVSASLGIGVAVVDAALHVQVWNSHAADLWGVRADEVAGEHLLAIDIGLPTQPVGAAVREVLAGRAAPPVAVSAVDRRGRPVLVQVAVKPVAGHDGAVSGAVVLMDARPPAADADGPGAGADGLGSARSRSDGVRPGGA